MKGEAEEEEEAHRLKSLAEAKYKNSNLKSALKYAKRALSIDPNLDGVSEMVTSFNILRVAAKLPDDWYKILQLEPFAHINTIKKQYKKLALALHPDKNPYLGSEEAFKLVGEAFRFLSDNIKRKEYDMKLRIQIQDEKIGGLEPPAPETFWTACITCRLLHQFQRRYVGYNLVCPRCKKSFRAVEVETNEAVGDENKVKKMGSGWNLRSTDKKINMKGGEKSRGVELKGNACGEFSAKGIKIAGSRRKKDAGKDKSQNRTKGTMNADREGSVGSLHKLDAFSFEQVGLRVRRRMTSIEEVLERPVPKSARVVEDMMTLAEMQTAAKRKAEEEKIKSRSKNARKEEGAVAKKFEDLEIEGQENSSKWRATEIRKCDNSWKSTCPNRGKFAASQGNNQEVMDVEDSDFYNFDKDRVEKSFKKNQVWGIYDDDDGMPRHYALINEVVSTNPFQVKMNWLDLQNNGDEGSICLEKIGFHVSYGRFKVAGQTSVESLNIFSHVVDCERAAKEIYRIYPKKGSVWALYNEMHVNEEGRNTSSENRRCYDIVVFLTTYSETYGLSIAYLEKVNGFKTVFKRREIGSHGIRWLENPGSLLLSHQIPARKLCGDEAPSPLKECWELDPASLPSDVVIINQTICSY